MPKVYQPIVIEKTDELIEGLSESNFFIEYGITNFDFVREYILDDLTEKFINGRLDDDFEEMYTEDEFEQLLKHIIAGNVLNELKDKGMLDSYSDDNTEEMFFLTKEGKAYLKKLEDDENN
jgi:hypothetical protein